ncbi:hypothetical protein LOTGIDRAFT_166117 [Lottia gigantea]|uniref:WW domain-containing oxidoreductase n=1 Tax=Lottia gigantea TaxID=225164 RepID=V4BFR0_LOTGI|nr:hypothetical protein LOTGIDRAFT_166117 [Lottia gigantea]ESO87819.1 hypothetical protein LOTGIDRAFT_166117 [Lottia gigantea]
MHQGSLETDSEDEIPPAWEERVTFEGKVYYANHETKATQWTHPTTGKKKEVKGELPYGWERKITDEGVVFFIDHVHEKTTYTDPRLAFAEEKKDPIIGFRQKYDGSSTALSVLQGRDLSDQYVIVTGANSGIGYETVRSLSKHGASVVLACRDMVKANDCVKDIQKENPMAKVEAMFLDLAKLSTVKKFAENYLAKDRPLNVLILNAGVFGLPYSKTDDGLETTFQVNHLAQFYLTQLLTELLIKSSPSRVIVVSSESHRFTDLNRNNINTSKLSPSYAQYSDLKAYNLSKICNVAFSMELNRRLRSRNVTSLSLHPGNMMSTSLQRNWWLYRLLFTLVRPFTKSMQQGAATTVLCAASKELEGIGGLYFNNCYRCPASEAACDPVLADKLWTLSENMLEDCLSHAPS